ncbi:hypothetical protein ACFSKN_16025 [Mariniflexile gromovii]|uniref:Lipoprotein n=1 Tax=Mariniflexile gromovii TaxID=362523 RepID=A0ABS4BT85_9FLAO|nr:hypothetical protein [Mariniflexile gromovii]MBP0903811.1 hypothetical protein [Mariniflexile gromovii]
MKKSILIILFFGINLVSCQEIKKENMIEQFISDLFNEKIPAEKIIDKYLEIKFDSKNKLSLTERKNTAIGIIEKTRNGEGNKGTWLIPNNEIRYIKNPRIYSYNKYKDLSQMEISGIETIKENTYILLDPKKEEILQYFLLNEDNDKIISFSLFVKPENQAWFFSY